MMARANVRACIVEVLDSVERHCARVETLLEAGESKQVSSLEIMSARAKDAELRASAQMRRTTSVGNFFSGFRRWHSLRGF